MPPIRPMLARMFPVLSLSIVALGLSSCASHLPYEIPQAEPKAFSKSGTETLQSKWWLALSDAHLNIHITKALENNYSLEAVWQKLQEAQALTRREASELYPDIDIEATSSRIIGGDRRDKDQFSIGPAASYEVDLWGRIRTNSNAESLRARAQEQNYRIAALTLSADIALVWIRLIEAKNQLVLINSQLTTNEKSLTALEARFGAGQIRSEDILRQKLLIETLQDEKIQQERLFRVLQHQLAVLRGETPQGQIYEVVATLPDLPDLPKTGLPAELVDRRPDIRAARLEIEAADKDLAVAIRDQYPQINLSASYISEAARAGDVFGSWITSLAAGLVAPVFDGLERKSEIERQEARRAELINQYAQTVLEAFQEVEDALIQEVKQRQRINNLQERVKLARDAYNQIEIGYINGASSFLSLLSAQTEYQETERDLISAQSNLLEIRIGLYRALSGGFETSHDIKNRS